MARIRIVVLALLFIPGLQTGELRAAENGPPLHVDVGRDRHAISPNIYGINFADEALAVELRLPVRRWGGNSTTRYNWKTNISNRASDWFFENLAEGNFPSAGLPDRSAVNSFVDQNVRTGTDTILTVPMIGWTPDVGKCPAGTAKCNCGFSIAKYGAQQGSDWQWWPDCGNGVKPDGKTKVTGNDPADTSLAIGPEFVREWVRYLTGRYGPAAQGGIKFYSLDNEPMLWNSTHRDVHPEPTTYDEMKARTTAYAAAIKQVDPDAKTLGPVLWGWNAYFYSALDTARDQWWNYPKPDQAAHGGVPFLDWYLQQMRDYEKTNGVRILDYLDIHFYPQGTGVSGSDPGNESLQGLRLRSTRGLWDPNYRDESWINDRVRLIPRMRDWVANNYPGTRLALTEYNWGALRSMNGALAQADVLGIFGREQLDLATLWGPDAANQPWAFAFRMYRNYDGAGGRFGDTSVRAASDDPDKLSVFAAQRSGDNALTLMVINKSGTDLTAALALDGFAPAGSGKVYRYGGADLTRIQSLPDLPISATGFGATYPAKSITLIVAPASAPALSTLMFAHVAAGAGYTTVFTLANTGPSPASCTLKLSFPVTMTGAVSGTGSSFSVALDPGATAVMKAEREVGDVAGGWARLEAAGGLVSGVATFQLSSGNSLQTVAGVLGSQMVESAVIPVDNDAANNRYAGFAVANPDTSDVRLTIVLRREDGSIAGSPILKSEINPLPAGAHVARFLHQYSAELSGFRGSMTISAQPGEKFAIVALTSNQGLYTVIPVLPVK